VLAWLPALVGLGSILPLPADPRLRRGVAGLLGLGVAATAASLVHLAWPVSPASSAAVWLAGLALLVARRRLLREGLSAAELAGAAVGLGLALYWYQDPGAVYDSGLYYLQTVRWITEQPLRLGLANLHSRFGYDSLWHLAAGATELPGLAGRSYAFLNVLPVTCLAALAGAGLRTFIAGSLTPRDALLTLLLPAVGHAMGGLGAAATDQAAELLVIVALVLWALALEGDQDSFRVDARPALLVTLLAILVKPSAAPLLAAAAGALAWRRRSLSWRWALSLAGLCAIPVLAWAVRGWLLSGCAAFPLEATCVPGLPWSVRPEVAPGEVAWIRSWARAPGPVLRDSLADWGWLGAWAAAKLARTDLRLLAGVAAIGLALAALARPWRAPLLVPTCTALLGLAWIFVTAPDPRFAYGFLLALGTVPLAHAIGALAARTRARGRLAVLVVSVGATIALTLTLARTGLQGAHPRLAALSFPAVPTVRLVERTSLAGLRSWTPAAGDQCWAAPIPCTPRLDAGLWERGRMYGTAPTDRSTRVGEAETGHF
jgi:hypothetical protein